MDRLAGLGRRRKPAVVTQAGDAYWQPRDTGLSVTTEPGMGTDLVAMTAIAKG
jgi:hypothetical protein